MAFQLKKPSVLPGFGLTMGFTLLYLSLLVLIPLGGLVLQTTTMGWSRFVDTVTQPQILASYRLSLGASLAGALVNAVFGFLVAWVLVRYTFPGKKLIDAIVDLPFALPTAVSGIALSALYARDGWIGRLLPRGVEISYSYWGVVIVLTFIGLPFVVRTLQPALEDLDPADRRGGRQPGRGPIADLFPRDPAVGLAGPVDRLFAGLRPGAGRIRFGGVHRQHVGRRCADRADAHHYQAGAVRLRRGHGPGRDDAPGVVRAVVDGQPAAVVEPKICDVKRN